jgi:hypothetical protein
MGVHELDIALMGNNCSSVCYKTEEYGKSPGLCYEQLGETTLYNTDWRTVVYVDLGQTDRDIEQLNQYITHINQLFHATEIQNWTDCSHFKALSVETFKRIKGSKRPLGELIEKEPKPLRRRQGALNFIGEISKILFGTLDADDANYYNEQIKQFEENWRGTVF